MELAAVQGLLGRRPVTNGAVLVPDAARVTGGVAAAVVVTDSAEHERRSRAGVGAVTALGVLDALMCLPLGVSVPVADIGDVTLGRLRSAPDGCVEWLDGSTVVRRLATPPAAVPLVVVSARCLRTGLRRAGAFAPFATRVVLLNRLPAGWPAPVLEVVASGAGIWAPGPDGAPTEYVTPAPFEPRRAKPARWRFLERAYGQWLRSTHR